MLAQATVAQDTVRRIIRPLQHFSNKSDMRTIKVDRTNLTIDSD